MRLGDSRHRGLGADPWWLEVPAEEQGKEMRLEPGHVTAMGSDHVTFVLLCYKSPLATGQKTDGGWEWGQQSEWLFGTIVLKEPIVPDPPVLLSILTVV